MTVFLEVWLLHHFMMYMKYSFVRNFIVVSWLYALYQIYVLLLEGNGTFRFWCFPKDRSFRNLETLSYPQGFDQYCLILIVLLGILLSFVTELCKSALLTTICL